MMILQDVELSSILSKKIQDEWGNSMYQDLFLKIQETDFKKLRDIYEKTVSVGKDPTTSLVNDIVDMLLKTVPQEFAKLTFEKISLESKDQEYSVKFNVKIKLKSIKPYVEFIIKSCGAPIGNWKVRFDVKSSFKIDKMEIKHKEGGKNLVFIEHLDVKLSFFLIGLPWITFDDPKELFSKTSVWDLSKYSFQF